MRNILLSVLLVLFGCAGSNANLNQSEKPFNEYKAFGSVARIFAEMKDGSGAISGTTFAIDDNNLITAGHFCVDVMMLRAKGVLKNTISIEFFDSHYKLKEMSGVQIREIDAVNDICLVSRPGHRLFPVTFADPKELQFNDKVHIVGAPVGFLGSNAVGRVMNLSVPAGYGMNKILVDAAAAPGNSGSPVFNEQGKVIGMLVMGHTTFDHLSFCTPTAAMVRFLKIVGVYEI